MIVLTYGEFTAVMVVAMRFAVIFAESLTRTGLRTLL